MSEGASAFVGKPFRLFAMLRTVREVLDRTGARQMPGETLN
jgi:hypothetical protein